MVVDDGSTDGTAEVASAAADSADLKVIRHERNLGLGAALRTGFGYILPQSSPDDIIVTMDADGTHSPKIIPDMLSVLSEGHDVVIASRFVSGGTVTGVSASAGSSVASPALSVNCFREYPGYGTTPRDTARTERRP